MLTRQRALDTSNSQSAPKAGPTSLSFFLDGAPQSPSPLAASSRSPQAAFATKPPPILTVDLNVMTELETLSLYEERVMWVAVEASGVVKMRDEPSKMSTVGLDVVVVLDNSRFASLESLEIACDIVLHIASLSTETDDRIAVFCTSCRHFSNAPKDSGCLLHPLRPANLAAIRNEIASIKSLAEQPPPASSDLRETLLEAIKVLNEPSDRSVEPLRRERSHLFVLSPRVIGEPLANEGLLLPQLHCVCTAVIPYYHTTCPASNEWILPMALRLNFDQTGIAKTDCDHLLAQVADVLAYARMGNSSGHITDLQLDIRSSTGCAVESMLGTLSCDVLSPGQTVSTLVRVKVPAVVPPGHNVQPSGARNVDDAFADLEMLLGETFTGLFTVKAHYRQSLFPENNFVTVESTCRIKRPNPPSVWSISPPTDIYYTWRAEAELYKRFVFLVATQDPPLVALETLATFYENKRCSLPCSGYIERVRTELLHQIEAQTPTPSIVSRTSPSTPTQARQYSSVDPITPTHVNHQQPRHYPSHPHFSFSPHDSLRFTACKPTTPAPQTAHRAASASPVLHSKMPPRPDHSPQPATPFPTSTGLVDTPLPNTSAVRSAAVAAGAAAASSGSPGGSALMMANNSSPIALSTRSSSSPIDEARAIWRHMRRNVSTRGRTARDMPSWPAGYRRTIVEAGEAIGAAAAVRAAGSASNEGSNGVIAGSPPPTCPNTPSNAADVGRALMRDRREQREREWKRKALANKRSIGADTLRSLAMGGEGFDGVVVGEGEGRMGSPWL
ncbi:hypothetical protein HDK90DRAFT_105033 [Phyllosticta capitalensis]|uniref:VWFA domain-containing protein n=1 Tax=Phyllosticta capitalensis TaxID=121624 RepID=A0ABR1YA66_9PEZI